MLESWNIPIYKTLKEYTGTCPVPFHMPGHKGGRGLPPEYLSALAQLDATEIPGLDNLHCPEGAIKEAQDLAAAAFGADRTWFLVNGASCGVQAMILTMCRPGGKLIIGRDCHSSAVHAMMMANVRPVYLKPGYDRFFGVSTVITPESVEEALKLNPDAAGVFITRPSYYGICSDIEKISEVVHSFDKILAVDEAHGAHLCFNSRLPQASLKGGADICVQSAHKTLPAFTQGAYLHMKSSRLDTEKLAFFLRMLQTTSPSYMILSSLDIAREVMEKQGEALLGKLLDSIDAVEAKVSANGLMMLKGEGRQSFFMDKTRLVINFREKGLTGYEAERVLRYEYGIQVEMSDIYNIVCIATVADGEDQLDRLSQAACDLPGKVKGKSFPADRYGGNMAIPEQVRGFSEVLHAGSEDIRLERAAGRISKNMVVPYPPGIPVVCPGEVITEELAEYLYNILQQGGHVQGIGKNMEIRVLK